MEIITKNEIFEFLQKNGISNVPLDYIRMFVLTLQDDSKVSISSEEYRELMHQKDINEKYKNIKSQETSIDVGKIQEDCFHKTMEAFENCYINTSNT